MTVGRFAPSPTGELHLGNLRTALGAWQRAREVGGRFVLRWEDLDGANASPRWEAAQARDLRLIGVDWDGTPVRQSERFDRYHAALDQLATAGLTYLCYCSRREIREAAAAPHGHYGYDYPGTCRELTADERAEREATGRAGALRLRANAEVVSFTDEVHGPQSVKVDDFVLRRNDGTPSYHVAVVVDDDEAGVDQVVRADDLLPSAARQLLLYRLLGLAEPSTYAHLPLVVSPDGTRLAKRDGAVTLSDRPEPPAEIAAWLLSTLGPSTNPSTEPLVIDPDRALF